MDIMKKSVEDCLNKGEFNEAFNQLNQALQDQIVENNDNDHEINQLYEVVIKTIESTISEKEKFSDLTSLISLYQIFLSPENKIPQETREKYEAKISLVNKMAQNQENESENLADISHNNNKNNNNNELNNTTIINQQDPRKSSESVKSIEGSLKSLSQNSELYLSVEWEDQTQTASQTNIARNSSEMFFDVIQSTEDQKNETTEETKTRGRNSSMINPFQQIYRVNGVFTSSDEIQVFTEEGLIMSSFSSNDIGVQLHYDDNTRIPSPITVSNTNTNNITTTTTETTTTAATTTATTTTELNDVDVFVSPSLHPSFNSNQNSESSNVSSSSVSTVSSTSLNSDSDSTITASSIKTVELTNTSTDPLSTSTYHDDSTTTTTTTTAAVVTAAATATTTTRKRTTVVTRPTELESEELRELVKSNSNSDFEERSYSQEEQDEEEALLSVPTFRTIKASSFDSNLNNNNNHNNNHKNKNNNHGNHQRVKSNEMDLIEKLASDFALSSKLHIAANSAKDRRSPSAASTASNPTSTSAEEEELSLSKPTTVTTTTTATTTTTNYNIVNNNIIPPLVTSSSSFIPPKSKSNNSEFPKKVMLNDMYQESNRVLQHLSVSLPKISSCNLLVIGPKNSGKTPLIRQVFGSDIMEKQNDSNKMAISPQILQLNLIVYEATIGTSEMPAIRTFLAGRTNKPHFAWILFDSAISQEMQNYVDSVLLDLSVARISVLFIVNQSEKIKPVDVKQINDVIGLFQKKFPNIIGKCEHHYTEKDIDMIHDPTNPLEDSQTSFFDTLIHLTTESIHNGNGPICEAFVGAQIVSVSGKFEMSRSIIIDAYGEHPKVGNDKESCEHEFLKVSLQLGKLWGYLNSSDGSLHVSENPKLMNRASNGLPGSATAFIRWQQEARSEIFSAADEDNLRAIFSAASIFLSKALSEALCGSRFRRRGSFHTDLTTLDVDSLLEIKNLINEGGILAAFDSFVIPSVPETPKSASLTSVKNSQPQKFEIGVSPKVLETSKRVGKWLRKLTAVLVKRPFYFGVELESSPLINGVPALFYICITFLSQPNVIETEGIFRIPGNSREIETLKALVENEGPDLTSITSSNIHNVAGLFKEYLRELPQPLIPFDLYEECLEVQRKSTPDKPPVTQSIQSILKKLPPMNLRVITQLMQFLNNVSTYSDKNRMVPKNLAVCFGPDVLRAREETLTSVMKDMPVAIDFLAIVITNFEHYFSLQGSLMRSE